MLPPHIEDLNRKKRERNARYPKAEPLVEQLTHDEPVRPTPTYAFIAHQWEQERPQHLKPHEQAPPGTRTAGRAPRCLRCPMVRHWLAPPRPHEGPRPAPDALDLFRERAGCAYHLHPLYPEATKLTGKRLTLKSLSLEAAVFDGQDGETITIGAAK